jgi:hypothetical protein
MDGSYDSKSEINSAINAPQSQNDKSANSLQQRWDAAQESEAASQLGQ